MILLATRENIAAAASQIRAGGVVAFPTETVYGLGADATDGLAAARVFEIKERPSFDPLIVHVCHTEMLSHITASIPAAAQALIDRFWPGPLTVVLAKAPSIPDIVTAGLPSVGVRMPDHPVALELIAASGRPIAAPSANKFGAISPTTAQHVEVQLGEQVPIILDGGACRVGLESTIVSFVHAEPRLLRPGGIALEDIEAVIGPLRPAAPEDVSLAPGQLPRHYAPATPLRLVHSTAEVPAEARRGAALLVLEPASDQTGFARVEVLADDGDLHRAAANLFAALRWLDAGSYTGIYAVAMPERGLGRAIMDRLRRAQAG